MMWMGTGRRRFASDVGWFSGLRRRPFPWRSAEGQQLSLFVACRVARRPSVDAKFGAGITYVARYFQAYLSELPAAN